MRTARILPLIAMMALFACHKDETQTPAPAPTPTAGTAFDINTLIPGNLPHMPIPADNPMTVEGIALGRYLFYEERLSANNTMSCATCHAPQNAFTDHGHAVSTGIDGIAGTRSAMALINLGWSTYYFWDGRAATLEQQILQPVRNPIEMHETWPQAASKLQSAPGYPALFNAAFGSTTIDSLKAAKAIAQFLRTMISGNSRYDKRMRNETSFTADEEQGYYLMTHEGGTVGQIIPVAGSNPVVGQGGADCFHCHTDAAGLFTDGGFHNNAMDTVFPDPGREDVTNDPQDLGKFKAPTLRNIMLTAPYMHDGRYADINAVIDHYNDGGVWSPTVDKFMKFTAPDVTLGLDATKRQQLIAFLNALTDMDFVNNPAFSDPGEPQ